MKLRTTLAALLLIGPFAGTALAQSQQYSPIRHTDASSVGYASVLRVTPAWDTYRSTGPEPNCDNSDGYYPRSDNSGKTTGGTIIGAIVGGALGNTVGKGDGRKAATIAGAVAGGAIGHHVASNNNSNDYGPPPCRDVNVEREERRPAGFDVEYNYKGDIYVTRMSYDPGNRVRVRVTVIPDDRGRPVGY